MNPTVQLHVIIHDIHDSPEIAEEISMIISDKHYFVMCSYFQYVKDVAYIIFVESVKSHIILQDDAFSSKTY